MRRIVSVPFSHVACLITAYTFLFFCSAAQAQQARSGIWGDLIQGEPGDTTPFHEIAIPGWVEDMTRLTYCFSVSDTATRDLATAAGSQMSEMGFVNPFYANYPSAYLSKRDPNLAEGSLDKEIADYKRRKVRILAVVPPALIGQVFYAHPEWRRISTNTTVIPTLDEATNPVGGQLCLMGPWGDRLIDVLVEALKRYPDIDAFSFDGLHHSGVCYCKYCRDSYRAATGLEIPNVNMDDISFRRYLAWRDRQFEALIIRMQTRLKAVKSQVALVTWTTNAGRFGHFLDIPRNMSSRLNLLLDAPDQEFWMDESNRGDTLVPAFANAVIWSASNHRVAFSSPYLFSHGNPYGPDSFPPHEVYTRMALAMTWGTRPSMAIAQPDALKPAIYQSIRDIASYTPWITHVKDEPWAALVMSDNTRVFYGRDPGRVEERYLSNVLGVFRTAVEEHLPITVIQDWNLNAADLSRYKVLILPNTACLDDAQIRGIEEFVRKGGGLVASLDASLCDELGQTRKDFALSDLFGVHYLGIPQSEGGKTDTLDINFLKGIDAAYWEKRKNIFDLAVSKDALNSSPKLHEYIGDLPVTFKGQAVSVEVDANKTATANTHVTASFGVKGSTSGALPAVVTRNYGKGRVVYMAAGLDSAYYLYAYPYQRLIIADAIRWAANSPFGISIEAPMCVESTFYRQEAGANRKDASSKPRLIIHLFNDLNSTSGHGKPDDEVPLREEAIPINGIKLRIHGYDVRAARVEPEGKPLPLVRAVSGDCSIDVPPVAVHTMLVLDLAK